MMFKPQSPLMKGAGLAERAAGTPQMIDARKRSMMVPMSPAKKKAKTRTGTAPKTSRLLEQPAGQVPMLAGGNKLLGGD